jgi:hypothetical protein
MAIDLDGAAALVIAFGSVGIWFKSPSDTREFL